LVTSGTETTLSLGQACLLGVVQGLTEFLPVSSDGHLAVLSYFMTPMPPAERLAVEVALHLGTLVAVVAYFWNELLTMARALVSPPEVAWARSWIGLIAIGSVPAAIVGLTLKDQIVSTMDSLAAMGVFFLFNGTLLFLANAVRGAHRDEKALGWLDAVVIGSFQVLALLPGVSRSGTTISAALFRRVRTDVAATFSFLMSVPVIAGAIVFEAKAVLELPPGVHGPLAAGVVVSGVTGFAAVALLMRMVRERKLSYFAYYCWAVGLVVLAAGAVGGL
jgi:undecaprenyl-diphosphatase